MNYEEPKKAHVCSVYERTSELCWEVIGDRQELMQAYICQQYGEKSWRPVPTEVLA